MKIHVFPKKDYFTSQTIQMKYIIPSTLFLGHSSMKYYL